MNDRTTQRVVDSITRALLGLIESRPCPLDDLVEQYLADRAHEVTPRHHQQTRVRLHSLIADQRVRAEALGLPALADAMDLRVDLLDRWKVEQLDAGWARQTVRQYLAHLKAVTRWGHRKGLLEADPLSTLELPSANRRNQKRPRGSFGADEVSRLIAAARALDAQARRTNDGAEALPQAPLLVVAAYSAVRLGALSGALWADLDAAQGLLRLRVETAKTGREQWIVLHPSAVEELDRLRAAQAAVFGAVADGDRIFRTREGAALCRANVARWFRRVLAEAGLPKIDAAGRERSFHSLRHFATTRLAALNVVAAQTQAGHASLSTTQGYLHHGVELVRGVMSELPSLESSVVAAATSGRGYGDRCEFGGSASDCHLVVSDGVDEGSRTPDLRNHKRGQTRSVPQTTTLDVAGMPADETVELPSRAALRAILRHRDSLWTALERGPVTLKGVAR